MDQRQTWAREQVLEVILALLVTLPLGAYIAGTLVASQADMPSTRVPVVLEGTPSADPSEIPRRSPSPSAPRSTGQTDDRRGGDDRGGDDRGGDDDRRGHQDDDVRVVRPTPRDLDDDHGGDRDDHGDDGRGGDSHGGDDPEDSGYGDDDG